MALVQFINLVSSTANHSIYYFHVRRTCVIFLKMSVFSFISRDIVCRRDGGEKISV